MKIMELNANSKSSSGEDKTQYQSQLFANRLSKQYKQLKKWARRNRITSFRLYDRDIPEIPLACDIYTFLSDDISDKISAILTLNEENAHISANDSVSKEILLKEKERTYLHLYLYERPYEKDPEEEEKWLNTMADTAAATLSVPRKNVIIKTRRKQSDQEGHREQYEKINSGSINTINGLVEEQGQIFNVNLTDYIDTGLFFDHRPLRAIVRDNVQGKSVLNLYCYTGSFTVYAAEGKARRVESVDLSKTYLEWAQLNMKLNGFTDENRFVYTRQDVTGFLNQKNAEVPNQERTNRYDVIVLDPPTFSNSKKTENTLDINRDWSELVNKCLSILTDNGVLYFSTNSRRLTFDSKLLKTDENGNPLYEAKDITASTIPEDYRNNKIHRAWKITRIQSTQY